MTDHVVLPTSVEFPLVAAQPGIWFAEQISPHGNAYAVAHVIELNGPLDKDCMLQAIGLGLEEADSLRFRFRENENELVQWHDASAPLNVDYVDLTDSLDATATARVLIQIDLASELRVTGGKPLYRHILIQLAENHWYWYQRYHHILVDGYSFNIISGRIAEIYNAQKNKRQPRTAWFTPFTDIIADYQAYQQSDAWRLDAAFWQEHAARLPVAATISAQPLAGQIPTTNIHRVTQYCSGESMTKLLAAVDEKQKISASDLALALTAIWVSRLCHQSDFTAGFIFMCRLGSRALTTTGPVLNVLPTSISCPPQATVFEVAASLASELKIARRHQRYGIEQLQRDLGAVGDAQPLYGTVFNLKLFDERLDFDGIEGVSHHITSGPVRDLEIVLFIDKDNGLKVELLANAERYVNDELAAHLQRLPLLLEQFAAVPALKVGDVDLLTEQDHRLLNEVNNTAHPVADLTLDELLRQQVQKTPDAPALMDRDHHLTYREMDEQVNALAHQLIQLGVRPGDIVAVALPRSVFLSLALMAVVRAGAAWLPLDTEYPTTRLAMMLEEAKPALIITVSEQQERFADKSKTLSYDALLTVGYPVAGIDRPLPQHPAYIIYTSGSTGRPKGVIVGQQAIVNRLLWMQHQYPLSEQDAVLQKTPCSFDVSVWEFFWPLIVGARLVMAPPEAHRDPAQLRRLIADYQITTLHFVPSMLAAFSNALTVERATDALASLRQVFCSGEALPAELCRHWQRWTSVPLYNLYGPTEAAVDVTAYPAWGEWLDKVTGATVPIGFPIWNTGLLILDARLRPVPPGVSGELYLTGVQLAQGYLCNPGLTASRFVANPFGQGERMYRTGDMVRWLPGGEVEYLGRSDELVKIRGQRIELNEIVHALQSLPGVKQAVADAVVLTNTPMDNGGDERQLVGYLIAQDGVALDMDMLHTALTERLPPHMVPALLVEIDKLPLSANGKLDRKALPRPETQRKKIGRLPKPGLEADIAGIFSRLLQRDPVYADDDFFALGGHSLLAMRLAAELRRDFKREVSVGQVMMTPKVEELAQLLLTDDHHNIDIERLGFDSILPLRIANGPTLFCMHPASGFSWQFSVLLRYIDQNWSLVGIQSPRPNGPLANSETMVQMVDAHLETVLQVQPHGPYHFIGYSLGGMLAQNIAARLQERGEKVAFLGLLDTYPPESQNWGVMMNDNVIKEVQRERDTFLMAAKDTLEQALGEQRQAMMRDLEQNYSDAVRLLSHAKSVEFKGEATLFVAKRTLPAGVNVQKAWAGFVGTLRAHELDCSHVDIISPGTFKILGPLLNRVLRTL
ncbi:enterobactin synthase subunit F [Musicola paradisiaca]|uniref:Amino acid adenylation domain protein n=1 Tax=Musicola paradisiaca (strain Ech703) TaxID=579405 RepID=C6CCI4_MUSP7|nr:enterobactin synthase subunit F [Musicola paradisiaca]ACS86827.1 amino acid adenylation domain protein [Musicola paradisiaca Ech703]